MSDTADGPPAVMDKHAAHPIAGAWRPMLCEVVHAFVEGDYGLTKSISGVEPVSEETADHIRSYLAGYGATLVELPTDTWHTSVAQWCGRHWDVMVDLWTAEEGRSDLVLQGRIVESDTGPRLAIHVIYVP